jgi:hypothetical protein
VLLVRRGLGTMREPLRRLRRSKVVLGRKVERSVCVDGGGGVVRHLCGMPDGLVLRECGIGCVC